MENLYKFINKFGYKGFIWLSAGYLLLPLTTLYRFIESLATLKGFFYIKDLTNHLHFSPHWGLNSTFYYVEELMLERYGRKGYSYEYSIGRSMKRFFYFTQPSLWIFKNLGATLTQFIFTFAILLSYVYIASINPFGVSTYYIYIALFFSIISTSYYYFIFEAQNYNAVGWAFYPLFLFFLVLGNWPLASLVLLCIAFTSFTATLIGFLICLTIGAVTLSFWPLLVAIPAFIKITLHFRHLFTLEGLFRDFGGVLDFLGFSGEGKKKRTLSFGIVGFYFTSLQAIYLLAFLYFSDLSSSITMIFASLLLLSIALFICNKKFARFADPQTLIMLFFIIATFSLLSVSEWYILIPYIIAINPIPILLGFSGEDSKRLLFSVPKREPYYIRPILNMFNDFLEVIPEKSRIIELHEYSDDDYNSVFKNLRPIHEPLLYTANSKNINIVPDFIAIFDSWSMKFPLSDILKQDPKKAITACHLLGSPYVMMLVDNTEYSDHEWRENGFTEISRLDWDLLRPYMRDSKVLIDDDLSFRILKLLDKTPSLIEGGELIEREPNRMKIHITSSNGIGVIKYIYDTGWFSPDANVDVKKHEGDWPWIELHAQQGDEVTLLFR